MLEKYSLVTLKLMMELVQLAAVRAYKETTVFVMGIIFISWLTACVSPKMNSVASYRHVRDQLL